MRAFRVLVSSAYGGHSGYAFATAYALKRLGASITFAVPKGYAWIKEKLEMLGEVKEMTLPRRPGENLLRTALRWPKSFSESLRICKDFDAVVTTGSNFSIPPALVCMSKGIKVYTIEAIDRISIPSKAVRILYRLGATTALHWEEQSKIYPKGIVVGPVVEPKIYEPKDEGYLLVTTGTLGIPSLIKAIEALGIKDVVVQSGDIDPERIRERNPDWKVFSYTKDIHRWIAGASVVITHFPGLTPAVARLSYGKPTVMVQSPRHFMSSPPQDGEILARKLKVPYVKEISSKRIRRAIEEAKKLDPPKYRDGASELAHIIFNKKV